MPSHVDATAATTGLNIRGDRGIRENLDNGSSANTELVREWPELMGLELPRQVYVICLQPVVSLLIMTSVLVIYLMTAQEAGRNAPSGNEDQRWCRAHARCPNQGQLSYLSHRK